MIELYNLYTNKEMYKPMLAIKLDLENENGEEALTAMSIKDYEKPAGRFELYKSLDEGLDEVENKKVRSFKDALLDIKKDL